MDDRNTVSLADFGIYQFSNDILDSVGVNDINDNDIREMAAVVKEALSEDKITADEFLEKIKDVVDVSDNDELLDIVKEMFGTGGDSDTLSVEDMEAYANQLFDSYLTDHPVEESQEEDVILTSTDKTISDKTEVEENKEDEAKADENTTYSGISAYKIQHDEQTGEDYIISDSWDSNKKDNLDCPSRIVYNIYGVSYYSDEGKKLYQALVEKNPEFFKESPDEVYANRKLILVKPDINISSTEDTEDEEGVIQTSDEEEIADDEPKAVHALMTEDIQPELIPVDNKKTDDEKTITALLLRH